MAEENYSLDLAEILQEERRQLSWIVEDMTALYNENSKMIDRIKNLNQEFEEFSTDKHENSYDDSLNDVDDFPDVRTEWLEREAELRGTLAGQLSQLCQDLSHLHHRGQHQPQHHSPHHRHLPQHMWGHLTRKWPPPSSAQPARVKKRKQPEKLLRWLERQMQGRI